jgi:hypothetical protein
MAEHALRAAQHLASQCMVGLTTEIRQMDDQCRALERLPRGSAPDAIRIVIPRMIQTLYTLRNKRSGGHTAAEVSPSAMDAAATEHLADWLMAELLRLGHKMPPDMAASMIGSLMERRIPAVYREGNFRRVLATGLPTHAPILMLLYAEPTGATIPELQAWSRLARSTLSGQLAALENANRLRVDKSQRPHRVTLLPPGEREVEQSGWPEPA